MICLTLDRTQSVGARLHGSRDVALGPAPCSSDEGEGELGALALFGGGNTARDRPDRFHASIQVMICPTLDRTYQWARAWVGAAI